jgi:hypothetical protein
MVDTLIATHVKAFITNTANNSNIGRHFRFIVANASGNIIESSDEMTVTAAMENQWVTGEIHNFALTSTNTSLYVGIEMLDGGTYLGVQEEAPLRDTTYYKLVNGTLSASTVGRQMINAVLESYMPNELALNYLVHPDTNCDLGHESIVVNMTNNGAVAMQAGKAIYYSVNGSTPVAATIDTVIASHQTIDYTFPVQYDFTNNLVNIDSTYNIVVWVDVIEGDRVRSNDTLDAAIVSYGKAPMPTVESPVHVNYHENGYLTASDATEGMIHFWYTNSGYESWVLQGVGDPFVTPTIYFDTMYYVSSAPGQLPSPVQVGTINTATASNNITQPFVFNNGYSRGKILYKAAEMQNPEGQLTKIELYVASAATIERAIPIRLYVMNTDLNALNASPVSTWDDEVATASLIYDGEYNFNTVGWVAFNLPEAFDYEGGNLLILTETYYGNTGISSGAPTFNSTAASNCVLYKGVNNSVSNFTGNYSTYGKRLNMRFQFVEAGCQSEKVPVQVIADNVPIYDVEPVELVYPDPQSNNNCTLLDENITVKVRNLINNTIPANTVEVVARFYTNTINRTVSYIIPESFEPNEEKTVTFTNTIDLRAPNADITYNYVIVTDLIGTSAYRGNDTIRGTLTSKKTAPVHEEVTVDGEYLHTYSVYRTQLQQSPTVTKWSYTGLTSGSSTTNNNTTPVVTTPVLYDTAVYYIVGTTPPGNGCPTDTIKFQINVTTPLHDISTDELISPLSYQCGISNPHLKVNVTNTWYEADTIPANTFKLKAEFTDATSTSTPTSTSVDHTISQPIYRGEPTPITFGNTVTLGSPTRNNIYNYTIYSNPVNSSMYVYRANDTIRGRLYVPATPATPANMTVNAPYNGSATVSPSTAVFNQFSFYDQPTGGAALAQGTSFVTPPIVANPTLFYYSGRILDSENFDDETIVGTSTTHDNVKPFDFSKENSVGIIMYTNSDLGFSKGIIDTIFLYVHTAGNGGIPIRLYLKNDSSFVQRQAGIDYPNLTPALMNTVYHNKWTEAVNNAQLILDEAVEFDHTGWYAIPIPGGFQYTGKSLLLLTEHHGKNSTLGYTAPELRISNVPSVPSAQLNKRVLQYANDSFDPSTAYTFTSASQRFNTKFSISYTCESAGRGVITVNTVLPNIDLVVESIDAPVTPNNDYTNNETVTVRLTNHGRTAATNYSLSYQLEGMAPVTVNNPVTVGSGSTVSYSFTTPIDLSELYFPQSFKVYVSCSEDNYPENDTLAIILTKDICKSGSLNAYSPCIANIKFAGIDNVPLPAGWSPFGTADTVSYTDYTRTVAPAILVKGQTYQFSMTNSFTGNSGVKLYKYVFIDFNRDGEFSTSSANQERVFSASPGTFTNQHPEKATSEGVISVPANASEGVTLMRAIAATSTPEASTGCGYYDKGETEDYMVIITDPYNKDLAVVDYWQPVGESCPDDNANVKVSVKNYGTETINFTVARPLELIAEVTGAVQGTYNNMFSNGSLAPGESKTFTIPNVNIGTAGDYTIVTRLNYADDEYLENNSWKGYFSVGNLVVDTVPFLDNFDAAITDPDNPFGEKWVLSSSNTNYKWDKHEGMSPNVPNAGPDQDHTVDNMFDRYALVAGRTNLTSTVYACLTTRCLDLHYRNGYPIQLDYWEHIFGQSNAKGTLLVQVGTGDNFKTVDSVVGPTQTSSDAPWKHRLLMFSDYDEVAKVRFRTFDHSRVMDIAMDDVNFGNGRPDIGIDTSRGFEGIIYPTDFRDDEASCMVYGDTVHPVVAIENTGMTPVDAFDIKGRWTTGNEVIEYVEHWEAPIVNGVLQPFMPGDVMEYRFTNVYEVFTTSSTSSFMVELMLPLDQDPYNNKATIHPCATTSIEDYVKEDGLVLYQNVPNPAESKTRISFIAPRDGQAVIEIFSLTGQKLHSEPINAKYGENYIDVNTSSYAAGMYIYTLQFEGAVLSKKMIIQK